MMAHNPSVPPIYHEDEIIIRHQGFMPSVHVLVCNSCGAMVRDKDAHATWHSQIDRIIELILER